MSAGGRGPVLPPVQTAKPSTQVQNAPFGTFNNIGRRRKIPPPIVLQRGPAQGLEQTGNRQTDRLQQSIKQAASQITSLPFAQGCFQQNLSLSMGANQIPHGLPQAWRGAFLCTFRTAGITWYVDNTAGYPSSQYITVNVSGNCTADLWCW